MQLVIIVSFALFAFTLYVQVKKKKELSMGIMLYCKYTYHTMGFTAKQWRIWSLSSLSRIVSQKII